MLSVSYAGKNVYSAGKTSGVLRGGASGANMCYVLAHYVWGGEESWYGSIFSCIGNSIFLYYLTEWVTDRYIALFGFVYPSVLLYDPLCSGMGIYGLVWVCMFMFGHLWMCMVCYRNLWSCMDLNEYVMSCTVIYGYLWVYLFF